MSLYLVKNKINNNFLHRKYRSKTKRSYYRYLNMNKIDRYNIFYSAQQVIDAASYPSIGAIKNSLGKWETPHYPDKKDKNHMVLPDYIEIYVLHQCVNNKINLFKYEGKI